MDQQYNLRYLPIVNGKYQNFAFIHINKTGGTSIAKSIGLLRKVHYTVRELESLVGTSMWQELYKFSIVRNPWDKVVSHYKYRVMTNQTKMGTNPISFKKWVTFTYGGNRDLFYYNKPKMFLPQVDWLKDVNNEICLDAIGRFEHIERDFRFISGQLGIEISSLPHLNQTPGTNYRDFYDEQTRDIVADYFKEDLLYFGYDF